MTINWLRLSIPVCVMLSSAGCKDLAECQLDSDCQARADSVGQRLFCSDSMCVVGSPRATLCTETYPTNSPANATSIGALVNTVTGSDLLRIQAVKMAVDEMNMGLLAAGKPPLALHVCETSATTGDMLKSYQVLVNDLHAVAVIGPSGSGNVSLISAEVMRLGVPIMSWSASSRTISDLPASGLFFRTVPSDLLQGPVLAKQIPAAAITAKSLGLVSVDDPYGQGLQQAVLAATSTFLPKPSLTYKEGVGTEEAAALATLNSAVSSLKSQPVPQALVAVTNLFSDKFVASLVGYGTATTPQIVMADGAKSSKLLDLLSVGTPTEQMNMANNLKRVIGTAPGVDSGAVYSTFVTKFMLRWQGTSPTASAFSAYAYDAAYAVGIAICAAGEVTPARVSEYLLHLNSYQCPPDQRAQVGSSSFLNACNRVAAQSNLAMQGTTGIVSFTSHGDREQGIYERWSIDTAAKAFVSMPPLM